MSRTSVLVALLFALAATPVAAQEAQGQEAKGQLPPANFKIGVVDLAQVFKSYKRSKEMESKLNDQMDRLTKELEDLRKQINEISKELEMLSPDSEAFALKEEERKIAVARFELKKDRRDTTLRKLREEFTLLVLDDIESVVKSYGEEQKFTLILKVEAKPTEETRLLAGLKSVLYYDAKQLDITDSIIQMLNRRFELNPTPGATTTPTGAAPPPAPPSTPPPPKAPGK